MSKKNSSIKINKLSFYSLIVLGIYYLAVIIIAAVDIYGYFEKLIWMGMAGTLALLALFAYVSWNFVANKAAIYKLVYVIMLLLIATGIILVPALLFG